MESFAKAYATKQAQEGKKTTATKGISSILSSPKIKNAELELAGGIHLIKDDNFLDFMEKWRDTKGVIHAIPCKDPRRLRVIEVGLQVETDETIKCLLSTESVRFWTPLRIDVSDMVTLQMFDKDFKSSGFFVPQQQMSVEDITEVVDKLGKHLVSLGMMGFFTVEFMAWTDETVTFLYRTFCMKISPSGCIGGQKTLGDKLQAFPIIHYPQRPDCASWGRKRVHS
jgi:hypothetical protein